MKNNEFDFIRDKFNNAMPDVPDTLDESVIEQKIHLKSEHKRVKFAPRANYKPIVSIAACFVLIAGVCFGFYPDDRADTFKSEDELMKIVSSLERASEPGQLGGNDNNSQQQEDGVIEASHTVAYNGYTYKIHYDENYIQRDTVNIYIADSDEVPVTVIDNIIDENADKYLGISNIYVCNDKLFANLSGYGCDTTTKVYDISNPAMPKLLLCFEQSGRYIDSRIIDGVLYIITSYIPLAGDDAIAQSSDGNSTQKVKPKNTCSFENPSMLEYVLAGAVNTESLKRTDDIKAILGACGETVYKNRCFYALEQWDSDNAIIIETDNGKIHLKNNTK